MPATIVTSCLSQSSQSQFDPRGGGHKMGGYNPPSALGAWDGSGTPSKVPGVTAPPTSALCFSLPLFV